MTKVTEKIKQFLNANDGNYLEIGVYYGDTFFEIVKGHPNKQLYGIDPYIADGWTGQHKGVVLNEAEQRCDEQIKKYTNAVIFKKTSKAFNQSLTPEMIEMMNVSVVFIDGAHWYEDVMIDCELALKLIGNKKGFIIFDDLHISGVRGAISDSLKKYPQLHKVEGPSYLDICGFYSVNE